VVKEFCKSVKIFTAADGPTALSLEAIRHLHFHGGPKVM